MLRHIDDVIGCSGFCSHHIFNWMHFGRRSGALDVFFRGWEGVVVVKRSEIAY